MAYIATYIHIRIYTYIYHVYYIYNCYIHAPVVYLIIYQYVYIYICVMRLKANLSALTQAHPTTAAKASGQPSGTWPPGTGPKPIRGPL